MSLMEGPRRRSCGTPQGPTRSQCRCTDLNEHIYFIIMAIKLIIIKYSKANVTVINMILIDLGGKSLINSAGFEITPPHSWGKVVEKLLQFYCYCRSMWKHSWPENKPHALENGKQERKFLPLKDVVYWEKLLEKVAHNVKMTMAILETTATSMSGHIL